MNTKLFLGIVLVIALLTVAIMAGDNNESEEFGGGRSGGGGFGGDWEVKNSPPGFCIETTENIVIVKEVV